MKVIDLVVPTGKCTVEVGAALSDIERVLKGRRAVAITDRRVREVHGDRLPSLESVDIAAAETKKTLDTVGWIYERLIDLDADRSTVLVGIGGGVTLDIAGFAASTFLRGLAFIAAPTTLLAQADASVGGKNGVNCRGYKNMIGTFSQPERVVCDHRVLKTLHDGDRRNGLVEIIKHAVIGDERLFRVLEEDLEDILALKDGHAEDIIFASLTVKAGIVAGDEKESGERRKLNLGHTVGHALEKVFGICHGDAVAIGLSFAARFANRRGRLGNCDTQRIIHLLNRTGCPPAPSGGAGAVIDALMRDKKRTASTIHFVFPAAIGRCVVEEISVTELAEAVHDLY